MIATRIKEELTPNKSESQRNNYYQKGKQTTAKKNCKQARNSRMQHRSTPGQWRQQHFSGHVTADQIFFLNKKICNLVGAPRGVYWAVSILVKIALCIE